MAARSCPVLAVPRDAARPACLTPVSAHVLGAGSIRRDFGHHVATNAAGDVLVAARLDRIDGEAEECCAPASEVRAVSDLTAGQASEAVFAASVNLEGQVSTCALPVPQLCAGLSVHGAEGGAVLVPSPRRTQVRLHRQRTGAVPEPLPSLDRLLPVHVAYVRSVVCRLRVRPAHCGEDLVQQALIEAHRSRPSRLDVRALLYGITRHVVLSWKARCRAERRFLTLLRECTPATLRSPEEEYMAAEMCGAVRVAAAELPPLFREVFVRAEIREAPMPEVAADLSLPLSTGYTRLFKARLHFARTIQRMTKGRLL
jgi:DNA-directed RNA polymerase specialized sigma24 family protein